MISGSSVTEISGLEQLPNLIFLDVSYQKMPHGEVEALRKRQGLTVVRDEAIQPYTDEWYAELKDRGFKAGDGPDGDGAPETHEVRLACTVTA